MEEIEIEVDGELSVAELLERAVLEAQARLEMEEVPPTEDIVVHTNKRPPAFMRPLR